MYKLFSGIDAFPGNNIWQIIIAKQTNKTPEIPKEFPIELKKLVCLGWSKEPEKRPGIEEFKFALTTMLKDEEKQSVQSNCQSSTAMPNPQNGNENTEIQIEDNMTSKLLSSSETKEETGPTRKTSKSNTGTTSRSSKDFKNNKEEDDNMTKEKLTDMHELQKDDADLSGHKYSKENSVNLADSKEENSESSNNTVTEENTGLLNTTSSSSNDSKDSKEEDDNLTIEKLPDKHEFQRDDADLSGHKDRNQNLSDSKRENDESTNSAVTEKNTGLSNTTSRPSKDAEDNKEEVDNLPEDITREQIKDEQEFQKGLADINGRKENSRDLDDCKKANDESTSNTVTVKNTGLLSATPHLLKDLGNGKSREPPKNLEFPDDGAESNDNILNLKVKIVTEEEKRTQRSGANEKPHRNKSGKLKYNLFSVFSLFG